MPEPEVKMMVRNFGPCGDCKFYIVGGNGKGACHEGPPRLLAMQGRAGGVIGPGGGGQSMVSVWPPLPPDAPGCGRFLIRRTSADRGPDYGPARLTDIESADASADAERRQERLKAAQAASYIGPGF